MKKFLWLLIGLVLFVLFMLWLSYGKGAQASTTQCKHENAECTINQSGHNCCQGLICVPFNGVSGNGKCRVPKVTPTNTPTPTVTPSVTPTPTEVIEPSPTPTDTQEEPTPTNKPEEHHDEDTTDHNKAGSWSDPVCTVESPPAPILTYKRLGPTMFDLFWQKIDRADHFALNYGYYGSNLVYGIPWITGEATETRIAGLLNWKPVNVCVFVWRDNCVSKSCIDP